MLKEKINEDFKTAFKEGKSDRVSILKMVKAALLNREKEKQYQSAKAGQEAAAVLLNDEEIIEVVASEIKKLRDSLALFEQGGRADLAQNAKNEISILMAYLPKQLGENEIKDLVARAKEQSAAAAVKDMGRVMAILMPQVKGRADSSLVSRLVKEALQS